MLKKSMKKIYDKWYLIGGILISYGIVNLGIRCYDIIQYILKQKKRTVIVTNGIETIGSFNPDSSNIILLFLFITVYSTVFILLGIYIIKKGKNRRRML